MTGHSFSLNQIKNIISQIAHYEGISLLDYNLKGTVSYKCNRDALKGKNVRYYNSRKKSPFVSRNSYIIYEVPSRKNINGSLSGEFLFLAYNIDFDYFIAAILTESINRERTKKNKMISERASFDVIRTFCC